jgi:hypothetical protein
LRQKLNSVNRDNVEDRHWHAAELCQLFEACGVAEDLVMQSINRLYERRLVEALDPNVKQISIADKVAIKESGLAHIEMTLNSEVYIELMAPVTGVNELFTRDEMRRTLTRGRVADMRDVFIRYIQKIAAGRIGIPENPIYSQLDMARRQIAHLRPQRGRANPFPVL